MKKLLTLLLLCSLSLFVYADYDSALAAFRAGDYETAFKEYLPLAEAGDAKAQTNLGRMYENGFGVQQDDTEAFKWFRKAAEQGLVVVEVQNDLGVMYQNGTGVQQDYAVTELLNLGVRIIYDKELGVSQSSTEAERDQDDAVLTVDEIIKQGDEITPERLAGYKDFDCGQIKAELTHAAGRYEYAATPRMISGTFFVGGDNRYIVAIKALNKVANEKGCEVRSIECSDHPLTCEFLTVKWFRKAADQGNAEAQTDLGWMYKQGLGVPQDYAEAIKWYRMAVEQGFAEAQYSLGLMYTNGFGVQQDFAEASKWFRKAAEQGLALAQAAAGYAYQEGLGVQQDYDEAFKWARKAAEQGLVLAQNSLGFMYFNGQGVSQDYGEALKWYRKAAEQGDVEAQSNLGFMYNEGLGVNQDYVQAYAWSGIAAEGGYQPAQNGHDMIGAKLNPTQLEKADKLTKEFRRKYGNKSDN